MGLSTRDEIGESPHSPPVRGSSTESDRPAVNGHGRRCEGASPRGEGPYLGHKERRGSPWQARSDEADRWWGTGDFRLEKRCRAPAHGLWSGGELGWRLLQW
jgi:hypothetical protein